MMVMMMAITPSLNASSRLFPMTRNYPRSLHGTSRAGTDRFCQNSDQSCTHLDQVERRSVAKIPVSGENLIDASGNRLAPLACTQVPACPF
jgi:hypothetical protein